MLDLVSWQAFKTPTAVADFLLDSLLEFESNLEFNYTRIKDNVRRKLNLERIQLSGMSGRVGMLARQLVKEQNLLHADFQIRIPKMAKSVLRNCKNELDQIERLSQFFHPEKMLKKGYSITRHKGKVLTEAHTAKAGDILETQLKDGILLSKVQKNGSKENR